MWCSGQCWSCGEGVVEIVDDCLGVGAEGVAGAVDAASFGEWGFREVVEFDVCALDDGVFDGVEPPALVVGEGGAGLCLLGEPVGVSLFDGGGVGDLFVVLVEGLAVECVVVGGGVPVGSSHVVSVEGLVGVPDEINRPGAWWGGDPVGEFA